MGLNDLRNIMFGFIFFSIILIGGIAYLYVFVNNDSSLDTTYIETVSSASGEAAINKTVSNLQDSLNTDTSGGVGVLGWINILVGIAWNGLISLLNSLLIIPHVFISLGMMLGIPSWLTWSLLGIITVAVMIAIWTTIMRVT